MSNVDLSFKINTLISDAERFKKEIPLFELWTHEIKDKLRGQNSQRLPRGVTKLNGKKIEPMFEKRDYEITINDVMKSFKFLPNVERRRFKRIRRAAFRTEDY